MNYPFPFQDWVERFSGEEMRQNCFVREICGPADIVYNEDLRKRAAEQIKWGNGVESDVFVFALGEPESRSATKLGGLPYRSGAIEWPRSRTGEMLDFVGQLNFCDSKGLFEFGLPGDVLLLFANDCCDPQELHFEWCSISMSSLLRELPVGVKTPASCFGYRYRTANFPEAELTHGEYLDLEGGSVSRHEFHLLMRYQATQIFKSPLIPQLHYFEGVSRGWDGTIIGSISSVRPSAMVPHPFMNHEEPIDTLRLPPEVDGLFLVDDLATITVVIADDGETKGVLSGY